MHVLYTVFTGLVRINTFANMEDMHLFMKSMCFTKFKTSTNKRLEIEYSSYNKKTKYEGNNSTNIGQ